jgi:hypothetical protein
VPEQLSFWAPGMSRSGRPAAAPGARLHELRERVRVGGREGEEADDGPVVEHGRVLRQEAVHPVLVAAQRLHDLQVVQLVPLLRKVDLARAGGPPSGARRAAALPCLLQTSRTSHGLDRTNQAAPRRLRGPAAAPGALCSRAPYAPHSRGGGRPRWAAHPPQLGAGAPPAQALVQVQHGDVGEVRHARDRLQEPEALQRAPGVQLVQALRRPERALDPGPGRATTERPRRKPRHSGSQARSGAASRGCIESATLDMGACRWALRPARACAHPAQQDVEALDEPGRLDPLGPRRARLLALPHQLIVKLQVAQLGTDLRMRARVCLTALFFPKCTSAAILCPPTGSAAAPAVAPAAGPKPHTHHLVFFAQVGRIM